MNRDDLVDRLAKVKFDNDSGFFGPAWDQVDAEECEKYAREVEPFVSVIVEFVAEWLVQWNHQTALDSETAGDILEESWRGEMSEAHAAREVGDGE